MNEKDTAYWYSPGIARDIITSWWCTENEYYFCYPHADGGFPNKGKVVQGERGDLFRWLLGRLKHRGYENKLIATDMYFNDNHINIESLKNKYDFIHVKSDYNTKFFGRFAYLFTIPLEAVPYLNGSTEGSSVENAFDNQIHAFKCYFNNPYPKDTI